MVQNECSKLITFSCLSWYIWGLSKIGHHSISIDIWTHILASWLPVKFERLPSGHARNMLVPRYKLSCCLQVGQDQDPRHVVIGHFLAFYQGWPITDDYVQSKGPSSQHPVSNSKA